MERSLPILIDAGRKVSPERFPQALVPELRGERCWPGLNRRSTSSRWRSTSCPPPPACLRSPSSLFPCPWFSSRKREKKRRNVLQTAEGVIVQVDKDGNEKADKNEGPDPCENHGQHGGCLVGLRPRSGTRQGGPIPRRTARTRSRPRASPRHRRPRYHRRGLGLFSVLSTRFRSSTDETNKGLANRRGGGEEGRFTRFRRREEKG